MAWWDFFRVFQYAFTNDPLSRKEYDSGAGTPQDDAIPDLRSGGGGGAMAIRDTNEFVDLSTVTNRMHRYKEYERLRHMAEIEMSMTVFADEACVAGDTKIATPTHGYQTIEWLIANMKDERFLVYCWDFQKEDFVLGWAYAPRKTKTAQTIRIAFDDGTYVICTPDHRILDAKRKWKEAGKYTTGDEVLAFHRVNARTSLKHNQFPRVYTHAKGWIHERQFVDEWRLNRSLDQFDEANQYCRMIAGGMTTRQISERTKLTNEKVQSIVEKYGMTNSELKYLSNKKKESRRIVGIFPGKEIDVYDLSVEEHENFCTDWGVVHNCQRDEDGRVFKIMTQNESIKEELEFLLFHRKMLNLDQKKIWNKAKNLFINGDFFEEVVINPSNPKEGIKQLVPLPADSMYRIETTKGRLVEFQQSKEGPDYQSLSRVEVTQATDADLSQATAIRFAPEQIVHTKIGDDRKTFYPYGVSLIEAARGPAHQLRLMEDAMVVYRLTRAPERRIFYIDVQSMSSSRAEAFVERMKDQFKKKKVASRGTGASAVEERWHAPAADEDYWIPIRPNNNTRIETLPGAQNLGEIDDTVYFRNKLFVALNFPKNYFNNEDAQSTRVSLSAQDVKFARMIERLQSHMEDAIWEICERHLKLRGYPEDSYEDLEVKMTPPSDWRELSRAEVVASRIQNAGSLKGAQIMSDFDILTEWMKYPEDTVKKMLARLKIQKLEELKLQIVAQNPALLGAGVPGDNEEHISTDPSENNLMPGGDGSEEKPEQETGVPEPPGGESGGSPSPMPQNNSGGQQLGQVNIPQPSEEDIKKYNLDIKDYGQEQDREEVDFSEE
jgi:hypothetical protein